MILGWDEIEDRALKFSKKWKGKSGKEKQEANGFIRDFLKCFGIDDAEEGGTFEKACPKEVGDNGYIDYFAPQRIIIEMKTKGKDLDKAYEQLKDYVINLDNEEMPQLLMVSDFDNIIIRNRKTKSRTEFQINKLKANIRKFADIAGYETSKEYSNQIEVNVKASEKMAKLHDTLKEHGYDGHRLEVYLVRILFCLFADDTGIFPMGLFHNYIENSKEDGSDLAIRLGQLFEVLNMNEEARKKRTLLPEHLKAFRYINGGLFADTLTSAEFDNRMRKALLECCDFDWDRISPAIFGAMFQGVMDKDQRRELGAHYTSEENILKLINPLFLNALWDEYEHVKTDAQLLDQFHNKISELRFLDPACGCGNFLIITYRELRVLELEILKMKLGSKQLTLDIAPMMKVNVEQFFGIEHEDFPCQIAQVGMWLMDHQMNLRVAEQFGMYYVRLPLTQSATIRYGNALRIDWESVISTNKLSYILGNPPFVGFTYMNATQKEDMEMIFPKAKNLDYVSAWYMKAIDYMQNSPIECGFVSTNSICQGETLPVLWKKLYSKGLIINFAHRTFIWSNEAKGKAAVHCVIIGFSMSDRKEKKIYDGEEITPAKNINPYLIDAPNIIVESASRPLQDVPKMVYGNKPADGGNLIIEADQFEDFIRLEPAAEKYIRKLIGAVEYINNLDRYCLWLVDADPEELRKMPLVMERIEKCKEARLRSIASAIRKFADTPTLFAQITQPPGVDYIVVPRVSSERRRYVPIGFLSSDVIVSDAVQIIPNAELYHFGVLTSNVHNAWMRVVCGRLKSDYRYSKDIVYNNFPWPPYSQERAQKISDTAQKILNVREKYSKSSLAALYDPRTMPKDLLMAHRENDKAVCQAYGDVYKEWKSEAACVEYLMKKYLELKEKGNK